MAYIVEFEIDQVRKGLARKDSASAALKLVHHLKANGMSILGIRQWPSDDEVLIGELEQIALDADGAI